MKTWILNDAADFLNTPPLSPDFYQDTAMHVARNMLGKVLFRQISGGIAAGIIYEVEAYQGEDDLGCHAKAGRTPRTAVMYGPPGHAYVYFTYGMHWMLNVVADQVDTPAAVLIRAVHPIMGLELLDVYRPRPIRWKESQPSAGWTDGPAKICQAFHIDGGFNYKSICSDQNGLWIADCGLRFDDDQVITSPRVGLFSVPEPWKSIPWRWRIDPKIFAGIPG